jgi:hypothetical protein
MTEPDYRSFYGEDRHLPPTRQQGDTDARDPHAPMASQMYPTDNRSINERQLDEFLATRKEDEANVLALSDDQRRQRQGARHQLARDTGLELHILRPIFGADIDNDLAEQRGRPEDQALYHTWQSETLAEIRATYGDEADRWVRLTQEWVAQHPALAKMLGRRGLGSRREIVLPILERVRERHLRGEP